MPGTEPEVAVDSAKQFFLDQVCQIPGVLRVETFGGKTLSEQSFMVYIPTGDIATERRVYRLKADVYGRYPDARLDVWIEEASIAESRS